MWAESAEEDRKTAISRARTRSPSRQFRCGSGNAAGGCRGTRRPAADAAARTCDVAVWLPSSANGPIASTGDSPPAGDIHLAPWTVTALALDAGQSLTLLARCAGARLIRPGLVVGADLAYWTAALKFAGGLVMAGRHLPGLEREDADFRARWQPVITAADIARLRALAAAMPPAARAVDADAADQPPDAPAELVLRRFLGFAVDALVRGASREGPAAIESLHDQWMHALTAGDGAIPAKGDGARQLCFPSRAMAAPDPGVGQRAVPSVVSASKNRTEESSRGWSATCCKATATRVCFCRPSDAWNLKPRAASALGQGCGPRTRAPARIAWAGRGHLSAHRSEPARAQLRKAASLDVDRRARASCSETAGRAGAERLRRDASRLVDAQGLAGRLTVRAQRQESENAGRQRDSRSNRWSSSTGRWRWATSRSRARNWRRWRGSRRRWSSCAGSGWR